MLRSLVAILTVIYFAVSSGVVMNVHYCMGKRQSVNLNVLGARTCGCGKKSEKKGCCKTESRIFKLDDVQHASYTNYAIHAPEAEAAQAVPVWNREAVVSADRIEPAVHSPPLLSEQDTYLRNCVFRI
ncbi:HYC_CC_PP family protein [Sediminibacterium soli]|uniref:HYC_CC_PP family protein n=1 Tax=Sediminibacterium soli TaxID=2698829 RepID=UPI00137AF5B7|nr:hypothetical protein [Sediminibacterium soli]NCI45989.1 hypothetical protein [Sediminibacterium soli]